MPKSLDFAIELPELYVMAVHQSLSEPSGFNLVLTKEVNPVLDVTIVVDDKGAVALHDTVSSLTLRLLP